MHRDGRAGTSGAAIHAGKQRLRPAATGFGNVQVFVDVGDHHPNVGATTRQPKIYMASEQRLVVIVPTCARGLIALRCSHTDI